METEAQLYGGAFREACGTRNHVGRLVAVVENRGNLTPMDQMREMCKAGYAAIGTTATKEKILLVIQKYDAAGYAEILLDKLRKEHQSEVAVLQKTIQEQNARIARLETPSDVHHDLDAMGHGCGAQYFNTQRLGESPSESPRKRHASDVVQDSSEN